jgi:transposase
MSNQSRYLGVDVSKDTLVIAFERQRWQFANTKEGHRKFIAQLKKLSGTVHVACEATGPYHLAMCLALQEAGLAVTICNAARIRYFGLSEGILAKNDPIDAELIERFANSKCPSADRPLSREHLALSEMATHRRQIVEAIKVFRTHRQQVSEAALVSEIN